MKYTIPFIKLRDNAKPPFHAHPDDAGYDLSVSSLEMLGNGMVKYGCGLAFDFTSVGYACANSRSSVWRHSMMLTNGNGIIDAGYRGEVCGVFAPINDKPMVMYMYGERFLQLVFPMIDIGDTIEFKEAESLPKSLRGEGGYGSSGN